MGNFRDNAVNDRLILVDICDNQTGTGPKLEVHRKSLLHRAFSVFIFSGNRMLIQQRALDKYHSGGLWANACCSHPRDGEELSEAVPRRLEEELGINCPVRELFSFIYFEHFPGNDLSEHELDHVFLGEYSGEVSPDPDEVEAVKWIDVDELAEDLVKNPKAYSAWFHIAAPEVIKAIKSEK